SSNEYLIATYRSRSTILQRRRHSPIMWPRSPRPILKNLKPLSPETKKRPTIMIGLCWRCADQMVRESSGGVMLEYLRRQPLPNEQFILQRIGDEGRKLHEWMYDRFSLARELMAAGFREPVVRSASESAIAAWSRFCLDVQF